MKRLAPFFISMVCAAFVLACNPVHAPPLPLETFNDTLQLNRDLDESGLVRRAQGGVLYYFDPHYDWNAMRQWALTDWRVSLTNTSYLAHIDPDLSLKVKEQLAQQLSVHPLFAAPRATTGADVEVAVALSQLRINRRVLNHGHAGSLTHALNLSDALFEVRLNHPSTGSTLAYILIDPVTIDAMRGQVVVYNAQELSNMLQHVVKAIPNLRDAENR